MACVLCGRKLAKISPVWSPRLEHVTCLDYEQVKDCYDLLLELQMGSGDSKVQHVRLVPKKNVPKPLFRARLFSQQLMEGTCVIGGQRTLEQESEKFDVHERRKQIEQLKKTIKERLTSLNKQSQNIEALLRKEGVTRSFFRTEVIPHSKSTAHVLSTKAENSLNRLNPDAGKLLNERKLVQALANTCVTPVGSGKEKENSGKVRTSKNLLAVGSGEVSNLLKRSVRI